MTGSRKIVAIMFTDVVGYTAMMQDDEAGTLRLLGRHRSVVETCTQDFSGKVIQYYGDGSLSIFPSAVDAARCAIVIQRKLMVADAVPLRVGLHLGEILELDGQIYGHGVNLAARVQAQGESGSVLLSARFYQEISNHPEFNVAFLGTHELKNVKQPTGIYALTNRHLVVPEFQSHLTAESPRKPLPPGNLPRTFTSFIGRKTEINLIIQTIGYHQLCTITGPGGIGKTRISIEAGNALLNDFADGVWFVDLVFLSSTEQIYESCCEVLGLKITGNENASEILINHLLKHKALFIFDNCEQIINESASVIQNMTNRCRGIHIIATSRERLNLPGERLVTVPPLSLRAEDSLSMNNVSNSECFSLFIDRAQMVDPGFKPSRSDFEPIYEICRFLDGIPLAIELAAARMRTFKCESLLKRLKDSPGFLRSRDRVHTSRQRTLETMVDWSYQLLRPAEQRLFRRLGVFAHSFDVEIVEGACANEKDDDDILELLELLVDKSLITIVDGDKFRLLEVIKLFARKKLEQEGELEVAQGALYEHLLSITTQAYHEQISDSEKWIGKLQLYYDDLLKVLHWSSDEPLQQLAVAANLGWYWNIHFHFAHRGMEFLKMGIDRYTKPDIVRGRALASLGTLAFYNGDEQAREWTEEAIMVLSALPDSFELITAHLTLAYIHYSLDKYDEGQRALQVCARIASKLDDSKVKVRVNTFLAYGHIAKGEPDKALAILEQNIVHAEIENMVWDLQLNKHLHADCALLNENFTVAFQRYVLALKAAIEVGDEYQGSFELEGLAMSLAGMGEHQNAMMLFGAAKSKFAELGGKHPAFWWDRMLERYRNQARTALSDLTAQELELQGAHQGFDSLAMQLLDGTFLADRLSQG